MLALKGPVMNSTGEMIVWGYSREIATRIPGESKMSDKHIDYQFRGVSHAPKIGTLPAVAEEKGEKLPQLTFAQQVGALSEHGRKAISKYLPKKLEGLPATKQRSILGAAIRDNNIEAVKALIDCGVDLNGYDGKGVTPLLEGCEYAHANIVELLLINGADPNILAKEGNCWAPLHMCIANDAQRLAPRVNCLACAKLLLDHGADVNRAMYIDEYTPLHFINPEEHSDSAVLLLSRGADPLAEDAAGEQPELRPAHFQGLGTHVTAALESGNSRQVDRWITVVEGFLPDPEAASLLVEWAPLCIHEEKLSKRIHAGIERYLTMVDGDPPLEVLRYVVRHNARATKEEVLDKLTNAKLKPVGIRDEFGIVGNYSVSDHGLLLIELASSWAHDPDENHMNHVMAILKFVASTAAEAPRPVRDPLHNEVVKLGAELLNSAVPELVERASYIRDFIGQSPFALDKLE
jgi:hypothetical protein